MKSLKIKPAKRLKGDLRIPGDKSISHRAIMLGSLAKGETIISNFLQSGDCLATMECFRKMGIYIEMTNDKFQMSNGCQIIINGKGLHGLKQPKEALYVGNSGTTIRLMSGILAGQKFPTVIDGDESIRRRPMGRVAVPLWKMGAAVEGERIGDELHAPLKIVGGKLSAIEYEMPVSSAQVKSAILLAGLYARGQTVVTEKIKSRNHTERMMEYFGLPIKINGGRIEIAGGEEFLGTEIEVPSDISSAAFFMIAGLIAPDAEIKLLNVGLNPTRTGIIDVLHRMGADLAVANEINESGEPRGTIIVKSSKLKAIKLDGEIIPRIIDEIPIIAVAATQAEGTTEIRGAKELRIKESDRIATVTSELRKMGAEIEELPDGLRIHGPVKLKGAVIDSHGDHRIAMSAAIAGLVAEGTTHIANVDCIETSFPGFGASLSGLLK